LNLLLHFEEVVLLSLLNNVKMHRFAVITIHEIPNLGTREYPEFIGN